MAYDTDQMIKDLVDVLQPDWDAVLISTLLVDGTWADSFKKFNTELAEPKQGQVQGQFYDLEGKPSPTDLMVQEARLGYAKEDGYQAVLKTTVDKVISVEFYLSDSAKKEDVEAFQKSFLNSELTPVYVRQQIEFKAPRFKADFKRDMTEDARSIFPLAFSGGVEKLGNYPQQISKVIHQTALEMHECGFRAAAATMIAMERSVARPPDVQARVYLNRAFGIRIVHNETGLELFKGWIASPESFELPDSCKNN